MHVWSCLPRLMSRWGLMLGHEIGWFDLCRVVRGWGLLWRWKWMYLAMGGLSIASVSGLYLAVLLLLLTVPK